MTTNNRLLLSAVALVSTLALASAAQATLVRAVPFDQKVEEAQSIIVGKCIRTHSEWDAAHRWILTWSTFSVEQPLKGNPPAEVTVVTPGGQVGSIHQDSIGIPAFREGDERVIFVKNTNVGPTVLYFDQGAYDVQTDGRGEKTIVPVSTGAVRVDTQRGTAVEPEHARPLREFQSDVHQAMQRVASQKMGMMRQTSGPQLAPAESPLSKYRWFLILAVIGAALATWHLVRR
jgi:hypothetical protein